MGRSVVGPACGGRGEREVRGAADTGWRLEAVFSLYTRCPRTDSKTRSGAAQKQQQDAFFCCCSWCRVQVIQVLARVHGAQTARATPTSHAQLQLKGGRGGSLCSTGREVVGRSRKQQGGCPCSANVNSQPSSTDQFSSWKQAATPSSSRRLFLFILYYRDTHMRRD